VTALGCLLSSLTIIISVNSLFFANSMIFLISCLVPLLTNWVFGKMDNSSAQKS
jgi:hypothetical protein